MVNRMQPLRKGPWRIRSRLTYARQEQIQRSSCRTPTGLSIKSAASLGVGALIASVTIQLSVSRRDYSTGPGKEQGEIWTIRAAAGPVQARRCADIAGLHSGKLQVALKHDRQLRPGGGGLGGEYAAAPAVENPLAQAPAHGVPGPWGYLCVVGEIANGHALGGSLPAPEPGIAVEEDGELLTGDGVAPAGTAVGIARDEGLLPRPRPGRPARRGGHR